MKLKTHNRLAIDEIKELFKENKNVLYTSGVGTGKTFVFLGLADELFSKEKILYIVPKHAIRHNIERYAEFEDIAHRVTFVTFNQFANLDRARELVLEHDFVVIDEVHHLGSDIYGKNLATIMEETPIPFLGMTATPVRGDFEDVSNYFTGICRGISNFDAIKLGLMPPFVYRIGTLDETLVEYRKNQYKLKRALESGKTVEEISNPKIKVNYQESGEIIRRIVQKWPRNKWITFSSTIADLQKDRVAVEYAFPDYKILELHSNMNNLDDILEELKRAPKAVIMTVDMMLEGVHLKDINGLIMFRNVTSPLCFQQMLGRTCSIDNKEKPVVIDCSQAGPNLLAMLIEENDKGWTETLDNFYFKHPDFESDSSNNSKNPGRGKHGNNILEIGLGDHDAWTVEYYLREYEKATQILNRNPEKEEKLANAARKLNEFYERSPHFKKPSDYESFKMLVQNGGNDYIILKEHAKMDKVNEEALFEAAR